MNDLTVTRKTFDEVMVPVFAPAAFVPDRGLGSRVWDTQGRDYIDFAGGIAVTALGHAHPELLKVLHEQGSKLWHIGNGYTNEPVLRLARRLEELTFADRAFFANSGAEANEAALKLARRVAFERHGADKYEIISFTQSFHGRTFFTVSVGGQPKYSEGFGPVPQGIVHLPYNDIQAAQKAIGAKTCAVIVEPIQGEGGVIPADPAFLKALREACDQHGALLIFDEVITGFRLDRSGAQARFGVTPDLSIFAKAMANGFPVAAIVGRADLLDMFVKGGVLHGGTFNAQPVTMAAMVAVQQALTPGGYEAASRRGVRLREGIRGILEDAGLKAQVTGFELMFHVGFGLDAPARNYRDLLKSDKALYVKFCHALLGRGVRALERGAWFVSFAHDDAVIDATLEAVRGAANDLG